MAIKQLSKCSSWLFREYMKEHDRLFFADNQRWPFHDIPSAAYKRKSGFHLLFFAIQSKEERMLKYKKLAGLRMMNEWLSDVFKFLHAKHIEDQEYQELYFLFKDSELYKKMMDAIKDM